MSLYDPTLDREFNPLYSYGGDSPLPAPTAEDQFRFKRKPSDHDWVFLGEEFSLVPYAGYEPDPKWIKQIQAIDDRLVPVFIRLAFKDPSGNVETFTRNALGWVFHDPPRYDEPLRRAVMPTSPMPWKVPGKPQVLASIFRDPLASDVIPGIPLKPYVPFGRPVVDEIKVALDNLRTEAQADLDAEQLRRDRAYYDQQKRDKADAEADYRWDSDNKTSDWWAKLRDMPDQEAEEAVAMTYTPKEAKSTVVLNGSK